MICLFCREWSKSWCYEIHEVKGVVRKLLLEKLSPIVGEDKEFDGITQGIFATGETTGFASQASEIMT